MKRITLVLLTLVAATFGTKVSAQGKYGADSAECIKYLSYYQEYYKQKNYTEALPNWRKAFKLCPPTASQNMLLNGMTLLGKEIVKTKDAQTRAAMIDTVLTLNDLRAQYYPKYAVAAYNSKGQYITQYYKDPQVVYDQLNKIIEINQENVKPSLLLLDLNSAIELYKKSAMAPRMLSTLTRKPSLFLTRRETLRRTPRSGLTSKGSSSRARWPAATTSSLCSLLVSRLILTIWISSPTS